MNKSVTITSPPPLPSSHLFSFSHLYVVYFYRDTTNLWTAFYLFALANLFSKLIACKIQSQTHLFRGAFSYFSPLRSPKLWALVVLMICFVFFHSFFCCCFCSSVCKGEWEGNTFSLWLGLNFFAHKFRRWTNAEEEYLTTTCYFGKSRCNLRDLSKR